MRDPSDDLRADTTALFPVLEAYVKDIMTTFRDDDRVLWWDLYNEPRATAAITPHRCRW